jgi:glycine cleavage system H protein
MVEFQGYNLPEDLYYEENHFWVKPEGDLLVMGLDDFGQQLAGEIVYIQLPAEGKKLTAGKSFAKMESGKWLGKIYAPVNGELAEINEELELTPDLINEDCYGEGWMYKIKPDNMDDLQNLITGKEKIESWLAEEVEKYKDAE